MTSLEIWFKEKVHVFYKRASAEIHRVVNRAASLALYQRSHVNNVTALSELALHLMRATTFEAAQQLFDAAFAHVLPLHISERLSGQVQIYERPEDMSSVWDEPAPAPLSLVPAKQKKAGNGMRRLDDPMYEDRQEAYTLQTEELRKEADRRQRFERLFARRVLNLRSFASVDPPDRAILEEVINGCLNHPARRHQDETGNAILLLNPYEQTYMHLCSPDGILFLPCYQLELQGSPE